MAGALVGGSFLSASLQVLFDRLASREVVSFIRGRKLDDALLKKLERKLLVVHAVLNHAEVKQFTNPYVKKWLVLLKEAAYDAEDILDEIATAALRHKMMEAAEPQIVDVSSWVRASFDCRSIELRVEGIIGRLEEMARERDDLGLKESVGSGEKVFLSQRWPSTSLLGKSHVYGRDDEKEKMIELLLLSDNSAQSIGTDTDTDTDGAVDVIAIVGMGGAGKTTLPQLLYNDQRVKEHFDFKAWVCVSEEFDPIRVTKMILEEITRSININTNNLNQLQVELEEKISMKKFLLVLDDVWNEDSGNWALLQAPLVAGAKGSKIVVTTRSTKVAAVIRAVYAHRLGELSPESSWSLFRGLAFEGGDSSAYPQLESIGKKIVDMCGGLPLAIKAVGNVLHYSEVEARKWDDVLNSQIWDLSAETVLPAIRLSYYYLPLHLKRCFAYCSVFPKHYELEKEKLVLLWMAEGLLEEPKGKRRMEEVGELYFDELLSKSFFQISVRNKGTSFVMHDLIHDLAQLVSGEFSVSLEDGWFCGISEKTRHLSYFSTHYDTFDRYETLSEFKCLRTFLLLNRYELGYYYLPTRVLHNLSSEIRCLRVLCLCNYTITDLPHSIGKLQPLRYLDLFHTMIKELPTSVCTLYNLQTLILSRCYSLDKLPSRIEDLISLRYLDIRGAGLREMPNHIGQLKCLQHLSNFVVGEKSGSGIGELKELSNLKGTLEISRLQNVKCCRDAMKANLKDKRYIDELVLKWDKEAGDIREDVIDNLQPHTNLKRLYIEGFGGSRFPAWIANPLFSNLRALELQYCRNCLSLPPLGQLPSLKNLSISRMGGVERVGCEFYHYQIAENASSCVNAIKPCFPSLETLSFRFMPNWEKWLCCGCRHGEFPRLHKLCITNCPKLVGKLPKQLRSLKKLKIVGCPQLLVALLRTPAVIKLEMVNCGKLQLNRPAIGFPALRNSKIQISNLCQWKQLPMGVHHLSIEKCDSVETLLEEELELLQSNTTCLLTSLEIRFCCFSRSLDRVGIPTNALKSLSISGCSKLELLLPVFLRCHHPFLEYINLLDNTCDSLALSFSLSIFPRLHHFQISNLEGLEFLSITISEGDPTSLYNQLRIQGCPGLVFIELPTVVSAHYCVSRCRKLKLLAVSRTLPLSSLRSLRLEDCSELLFQRDGLPSNLHELQISCCNQLTSQEDWGLQRLNSLTKFRINGGCLEIHSFPKECLLPSTITTLEIVHLSNLKSLDSKGLQQLTSLSELSISDCPEFQSFGEVGFQHLSSLATLSISCCSKLQSFGEDGFQHLTSLKELSISTCPELESLTEAGLQHLISLEKLLIFDCLMLQYLTKGRLPDSLSSLAIYRCPLLEHRLQFGKGQDWEYIAHIPCIIINNVLY